MFYIHWVALLSVCTVHLDVLLKENEFPKWNVEYVINKQTGEEELGRGGALTIDDVIGC